METIVPKEELGAAYAASASALRGTFYVVVDPVGEPPGSVLTEMAQETPDRKLALRQLPLAESE